MMITILATATVHTSGVNWSSVAAIGTLVVLIVGGFTTWLQRTMRKSREEDRKATIVQVKLITEGSLAQVKLLTDAMGNRMDTIDTHLTAQDVTVNQQGKDLARIEGRMLADRPKDA
jgi:hypothetical protein